ncbi:AraC family transcriptional regulator [Clostridium carboxidivorans P7]|uniref:Transcriptional regulator, AraC family n=1 Tax=Clostridium carboxidivorans P7 TaxID=536227 RepID=C6PNM8_9CLOT|nr:helix-turn-helix domain-containing protein [Clostridium carboxidivorans]AKN32843.1 AraC family transcriptional regulator [Clostridium carboxidivorans P7]EET89155.1 transcriptional regulator, AraC family [Clostridium carboxidivorans P7]EFG89913.1 transcriptional regulator, AraC family [Clostridium carboxidivorans P7]
MNIKDLDKSLRELSPSEIKLKKLLKNKKDKAKIEECFSNEILKDYWVINNSKLMKNSEDISIHKHDRFIEFKKHSHDYLEMMFVYSGSIKQIIEDTDVEIKKGEILLMDMNVEHSIKEAQENDIAINVLIKEEFFNWIFMNQIADNDLISNFIVKALYNKNKFRQFLCFETSKNKRVWDFMINILIEYYENKNGMETAIRSYIVLIFNELLRCYNEYLPSSVINKVESNIYVEIVKYIDKNYNDLNLKDLANYFSYSTDYMGKLIKKVTGNTLTELQKKIKLDKVKYLLKNSDFSIEEIIRKVGYSNLSYFYKQFKEDVGMTPDKYRKNSITLNI